jgi:hypothetical protein
LSRPVRESPRANRRERIDATGALSTAYRTARLSAEDRNCALSEAASVLSAFADGIPVRHAPDPIMQTLLRVLEQRMGEFFRCHRRDIFRRFDDLQQSTRHPILRIRSSPKVRLLL